MNQTMLGSLLMAALLPSALAVDVGDVAAPRLGEYRETAQAFGASLKSALEQGIAEKGPAAAVGICQTKALLIAQEYANRQGWEVGRTSLKPRNPDNAPDDWERAVLESFEQRKIQGEDPAKLEYSKIVEENGEYKIRYMKAIVTGEVCQTCHGAEIAPEVAARIQTLYPQDQATGFKPGDLRGSFTITQSLSAPCVVK